MAPNLPSDRSVGPTAAGKTDLAIEMPGPRTWLFGRLDFARLYAGMDIGRAPKPTALAAGRVRIAARTALTGIGRYLTTFRQASTAIAARGERRGWPSGGRKRPYLQALIQGLEGRPLHPSRRCVTSGSLGSAAGHNWLAQGGRPIARRPDCRCDSCAHRARPGRCSYAHRPPLTGQRQTQSASLARARTRLDHLTCKAHRQRASRSCSSGGPARGEPPQLIGRYARLLPRARDTIGYRKPADPWPAEAQRSRRAIALTSGAPPVRQNAAAPGSAPAPAPLARRPDLLNRP